MKKLIILIIIIIILIPFAGAFFAGDILKKGVEGGGTWALGTKTELSGASLSLLGGQVQMENLSIQNPEGFKAKEAMRVGKLDVAVGVGSLMSDTIEIDHIDIAAPELTLEVTRSGSNLGALMDNLKARTGGGAGGTKPEPTTDEKAEEGAPSKKLKIGRVTISTPKVHLVQSVLMSSEQTIDLPTLELKDIGGGGGGESKAVTLPEFIEEIFGTMLAAVAESGALPADLQNILNGEVAAKYLANVQGQLDDFKKQMGGKVDEMKDQAGKAVEDAKKKAEESLKEGLGGLLGGKK